MTGQWTRRQVLAGGAGTLALAAISGCTQKSSTSNSAHSSATGSAQAVSGTGGELVTGLLTPQPATLDLGGLVVSTWGYGDSLPGPMIRAKAGDRVRINVDNKLPVPTSVHWHGIALRNDMDGVPGMTQKAIQPGTKFLYDFTVPDAGTYFYHPHVGVQLDRGLYGVLLVDERDEPGHYDAEWTVVLDDWVDGTGRTPDEVLATLASSSTGMGGMSGMSGMGGSAMTSRILGDAGDVVYPHYLINGRIPSAPETFSAKPGQRLRLRLVNAGSDTAFRVSLAGHQMTVTHTDGFPVVPKIADALLIGMGERFDVEITLKDGVFPLVAVAEGKSGAARAILRTASGRVPAASLRPSELERTVLLGADFKAAERVRMPSAQVDRTHDVVLGGSMSGYSWTINGGKFPNSQPLPVQKGERVLLRFVNQSMMFHPMHIHGHTFALRNGGARKDTVIVRSMDSVEVELQAVNPGEWAMHCHNIYHAESGMMTSLSYTT